MNIDNLEKLKNSVEGFIKSICVVNNIHNVEKIRESLIFYKLLPQDLLDNFTGGYTVK